MENEFNPNVGYDYQRLKLLSSLTKYGKLFKIAYEMGTPIYTDEVKTAAVTFRYSQESSKPIVQYLFNPNFYLSLNDDEKCFVIAHEALHLFFNHLELIKELNLNPRVANIAMDIVINETLVNSYGFSSELPILKSALLLNTVFTSEEIQQHHLNQMSGFMTFYELLKDKDLGGLPNSLDDHEYMNEQNSGSDADSGAKSDLSSELKPSSSSDFHNDGDESNQSGNENSNAQNQDESTSQNNSQGDSQNSDTDSQSGSDKEQSNFNNDLHQQIINQLEEELNKNQLDGKSITEQMSSVFSYGGDLKKAGETKQVNLKKELVSLMRSQKKYKAWEKIIKLANPNIFKMNALKNTEETFAQRDYVLQLVLPKKTVLPAISKIDDWTKDKIDLYFFFDTSGSCYPFRHRFAQIISEIPLNKYKLHLFNFDTVVRPIEYEVVYSKNQPFADISNYGYEYCNSNATLNIIERQIQSDLQSKKIKKYPPMVCVLSDAFAPPLTEVVPENLNKWLFIIISDDIYYLDNMSKTIATKGAKINNHVVETEQEKLLRMALDQKRFNAILNKVKLLKSIPLDNEFIDIVLAQKHDAILKGNIHFPKLKNQLIKVIPSYFLL